MKINLNKFLLQLVLALVIYGGTARATFLPPDFKVDYSKLSTGESQTDEKQFREVIKKLQDLYGPTVSLHGARLSINGNWQSETLNAGARQIFSNWQVVITGGLARRPELSTDGFSLIICHELGHHLGGFAFAAAAGPPIGGIWAANEGQADYFASFVCAPRLWQSEVQKNSEFRGKVTEVAKAKCDSVWSAETEQNLCYRILTAVESMTNLMGALLNQPPPKFETPDATVVDSTSSKHPPIQCRMDTSLQGALCKAHFNESFIPGKTASGGPFGTEAERESASNSCTHYSRYDVGLRPACWFKARM